MPALHPKNLKDFASLLEYLRDGLHWPFEEEDYEEHAFDWQPEELGLDAAHAVKIKAVRQLRPSAEAGPWGVFYVEFEAKRLPVVVLRRMLRALVPKARASANAAQQRVWRQHDLLFICAGGESGHRGITFAHFRAVNGATLAPLRTFGWDERETQFYSLQNLNPERLRWDRQADWAEAFTAEHGRTIKDAQQLALALARFARRTRALTLALYDLESAQGKLHTLRAAFQKSLIADLSQERFADTIAQTVAYGLFAGRATGQKLHEVGLGHLAGLIPETNPFLRELFNEFARLGADYAKHVDYDDLGIVDLVEFLNEVPIDNILADFGRQSGGGQDPVIHFYETFLHEYDAKARIQRGVYYTPKPVVDFIVRGVDTLLREELGCPLGLADSSQHVVHGKAAFKVTILDPATGTGTFLVSVIELIHDTMTREWKQQGHREREWPALWNDYVAQSLLPRLHGFELMMASYTVAHLKIGLKLAEYGYQFKRGERLRVYLTNTLEASQQLAFDLPEFLSHEAREAQRIKQETVVTVVLGNPPYAGISSNMSKWTDDLLKKKLPSGTSSYYEVDGQPLGEKKLWLQDDYVKFIRYSQSLLDAREFGVLGFITNHGYLDNPTFRGMRQSLMQTFDRIDILDLHGNSLKKEKAPDGGKDENVFDIQQGVGIGLFVRHSKRDATKVAHADLWGNREDKYERLRKNQVPPFDPLAPNSPFYCFARKEEHGRAEYEKGWKATSVLPVNTTGIVTARDGFVLDFDEAELLQRIADFRDLKNSDAAIRQRYFGGKGASQYEAGDSRGWKLPQAREKVQEDKDWKKRVVPCLYRPFDVRPLYYATWMVDWPRPDIMSHMLPGENLGLATARSNKSEAMNHFFCSRFIMETKCAESTTQSALFPLYLYNPPIDWDTQLLGRGKDGRRANLAPHFVAQLGTALQLQWVSDGRGDGHTTFGPEDVLAYVYALFHAPSYRSRYAEFLKIDFPRVPLTNDAALFLKLVDQGRALIALHLLDEAGLAPSSNQANQERTETRQAEANRLEEGASPAPPGEIAPGYPKYESGRVLINPTSGFDGVSEAVWNFHIGGYQVAHKWLKDRKGRTLTSQDAAHYRKIVVALEATIGHMATLDDLVAEHGGWPLPGSQEPVEVEVKDFFGARGEAAPPRPVKAKTPSAPRQAAVPAASARSIEDYTRDDLIAALLRACKGRRWHEREDVLREAARVLGFARTGKHIRAAFKSALTGALRRGLLEYQGTTIRRVSRG